MVVKRNILCSIWSCCIKNMTQAICHFERLKSHWKEYHSKKVALCSVVIPWAILCIYREFLFNPENSFHNNLPKFFVDHIYLPLSICHIPKIETIIPACTPQQPLLSNSVQLSLRKHPFLLTLRWWGRFTWRNVCDSATEIPYWWRKICPESSQKHWLVDGVVTLFELLFSNDRQKTKGHKGRM